MQQQIDQAVTQLRRGDVPGALDTLLDAWRARPYAALARAVELAGERAAEAYERQESPLAWFRAMEQASPAQLSRLLEQLPMGTSQAAKTQMLKLAEWPPDPRLASALMALILAPPYRSRGALPFWTRLFRRLAAMRDPRLLGRADELYAALDREFTNADRGTVRAKLRQALARTREAFPDGAPDDGDLALDPLMALLEEHTSEPELLAAIAADPDDDGPRAVYADWLVERGDPRGTFIALQLRDAHAPLSRAGRGQMRQLLKTHRDAWLGPLRRVLLVRDLRFRRGFPSEATLRNVTLPQLAQTLDAHQWTTLEQLELNKITHDEGLPPGLLSRTTGLKRLRCVGWRTLRDAPADPLPEQIQVRVSHLEDVQREIAALDVGAERLRTLILAGPNRPLAVNRAFARDSGRSVRWLTRSPLFARLEELRLEDMPRGVPADQWLAEIDRYAPALRRFEARRPARISLERQGDGRWSVGVVVLPVDRHWLARLPAERLHAISLWTSAPGLEGEAREMVRHLAGAVPIEIDAAPWS